MDIDNNFKSVIRINNDYGHYGHMEVKIKKMLNKRKVTINKISVLTGSKYEVVKKYINGTITRTDLDLLSRICYVLDCQIQDLMEYNYE